MYAPQKAGDPESRLGYDELQGYSPSVILEKGSQQCPLYVQASEGRAASVVGGAAGATVHTDVSFT